MIRRPFDWNGRSFVVDSDGMNMPTPIATNRTAGFGIIAAYRPTENRTRSFGFSVPAGSVGMMYGRDNTTGGFQMLHSSTELVLSSVVITLSRINVLFAWTYSASSHILAVNDIQTMQTNTSTMQLDATTHLHVGDANLASGSSGQLSGDMYWIGALAALPPLGLVDDVLQQRSPPTVLRPWLANLVPFVGNGTTETCWITGATMVFASGTPPVATRRYARPQHRPPVFREARGSTSARRYTLAVSHGGDSETTISTTIAATASPDAVLIEIPTGSDREIGISVNGVALVTGTLPANANAQSGDLFLGARLSAGAAVNDATQADFLGWAAANTGDGGARERLLAAGATYLAPFIVDPSLSISAATSGTLDLSTVIKDPAGAGYTITLGDVPPDLTASLVSTTLSYRSEVPGSYLLPITLTSLMDYSPTPTNSFNLSITVNDAGSLFANGYKYRRKLTRVAQPTIAAGNLIKFPIPVRISGQTWAKSVANGGKIEATTAIDLMVGDSAGNPLPFELRPNASDLTAGDHILVYAQDTNPAVAQTAYLYYGKRITTQPENPEATYNTDYLDIYTGGADATRNPAKLDRPWEISDVADTTGLLGIAGDFAAATAEVTQPSSNHLSGHDQFNILICINRSSATTNNKAYLGAGDLSSEGTSSLTVRDANSTTATTDTIKFAMATTGASRAQWRGASNLLTTDWQVLSINWTAGTPVHTYINGERATDGGTFPDASGTTLFTGPLTVGLGGGVATFGRFDGYIDELRLGKRARGAAWAKLEYLSLTNAGFVTIGAEELPGDVTATLVAGNDDFSFVVGSASSYLLDVLANDVRDPPGAALSISDFNITSGGGSMVIEGDGLRYTPASATTTGTITGSYTVTDGTLTDTGTFTITIREAVATTGLHVNPFKAICASHRPIGMGRTGFRADDTSTAGWQRYYGIPKGFFRAGGGADSPAVPGSRGRLSTIRSFRIEGGVNFSKHTLEQDESWTEYPIYDQNNGTTIITRQKIPEGMKAVFATNSAVFPPPQADNDLNIYYPDTDNCRLFFSIDWMTRFNKWVTGANVFAEYPLTIVGHVAETRSDTNDDGSSASRLRFPGFLLREEDCRLLRPMNYVVHATATRRSNWAWQSQANHILGRTRIWPAAGVDGSAGSNNPGNDDDGNPLPPNNQGDIPYGTLLTIRYQDWGLRNSATLNLSALGKLLFDQIRFYGIRVMDGNAVFIGTNGTSAGQGSCLQVRVTGGPASQGYAWDGDLRNEVNREYMKILPYVWPVLNTRGYGAETEEFIHNPGGKRRWYSCGGGPIDGKSLGTTECINTGYDAE